MRAKTSLLLNGSVHMRLEREEHHRGVTKLVLQIDEGLVETVPPREFARDPAGPITTDRKRDCPWPIPSTAGSRKRGQAFIRSAAAGSTQAGLPQRAQLGP